MSCAWGRRNPYQGQTQGWLFDGSEKFLVMKMFTKIH